MPAAYILMTLIGVVIGIGGLFQIARGGRAARRAKAAAAYRERLAGVMLISLGLALIIFAVTFTLTASTPG